MKLLLSHVADLDGISPIVLMNLLQLDFEYELFEIGEIDSFIEERIDTDYFDQYDDIYITDLNVSKDMAYKIDNSKYKDKFKLFDHHQSAEWLNKYSFAIVKEDINGFMECGTTLFYQYLVKNYENEKLLKDSVITYVELVREADTWQFTELKDESDNLNSLFAFYGREEFIDIFIQKLLKQKNFYFDATELTIIKCLNRNKQNYLESYRDKITIKKINDYHIGFVFAEQYRSALGNYLATLYQDKIDFVCIINMNRSISFRGIKDINISKFAKNYGGGGHPKACGMALPSYLQEKIIEEIFNES